MDQRLTNTPNPLTPPNSVAEAVPIDLGNGFSDVAQLRREQILHAADGIIASEGIHRLTLGNIEEKTGMSRGQLTYYFPTKEAILLAVFDRMLVRMITEFLKAEMPKPMTGRAWDCTRFLIARRLNAAADGAGDRNDFQSLVYTFLAQMNHRDDYRNKLSGQFNEWRNRMAEDLVLSADPPYPVPPRIAASLVQALLHGLAMQLAVDPNAFDAQEMSAACESLLAPLFKQDHTPPYRKEEGPVPNDPPSAIP